MSAARAQFIADIDGLRSALSMDPFVAGAKSIIDPPYIVILRRGILIAALIAFETFVRDRTGELLSDLGRWPAAYSDLPQKFRDAALLHSLSNLQRYANLLRRNDDNYEQEIVAEIRKMSQTTGPTYAFSKFVSGDHTGNLSVENLRELLAAFGIKNCWEEFRIFSTTLGFGVPLISELLASIIRNRHMSAHSSKFVPTLDDITSLPRSLTCLGLSFDTSMSASVNQALVNWTSFTAGTITWRDFLECFVLDVSGSGYRLLKLGRTRAIRIVDDLNGAKTLIPSPRRGRTALLVKRDASGIPLNWEIFV